MLPMSAPIFSIAILANYFFVVALAVRLWAKETGLVQKCLWTFVLIIPFAGPIFYLAFFNPAQPLPPHKRVGVNPYVAPSGKKVIDNDHGIPEASTRQQRKRRRRDTN